MKISFCAFSIVFATIILGMIQTVNAQSDVFKTYANNNLGFSIDHPLNWKVREFDTGIPEVLLSSNGEFGGGGLDITVRKVEPYLDTDTMTIKNTTLQQIVQQKLNVPYYANLIRENEFTFGGNIGWKVEYYNLNSDYKFEVDTIANGKLYTLTYSEDPLKVPNTLPLINKMLESFKIIK